MKDQSRLFTDTSEVVYEAYYKQLQEMRKQWPAYRDDQLLMKMLCDTERKHG